MKSNEFLRLVEAAIATEALKRLIFSKPQSTEITKISGRLVSHRGRRTLALELSLPGNTVSHKNIPENMVTFPPRKVKGGAEAILR